MNIIMCSTYWRVVFINLKCNSEEASIEGWWLLEGSVCWSKYSNYTIPYFI